MTIKRHPRLSITDEGIGLEVFGRKTFLGGDKKDNKSFSLRDVLLGVCQRYKD